MNNYIIKLKHDTGIIKIKTSAIDDQSAKKNVLASENCPESAIVSVKLEGSTKKKRKNITSDPKIYSFAEALADIAYNAGEQKFYSGNSRADIQLFIYWAEEFQSLYPDPDYWNDNDYIDTILEFTTAKINAEI